MKKIRILTMTLLTAIMLITANSFVGLSANANIDEAKEVSPVVSQYIQSVNNKQFPEAYSMTDQSFQSIIPQAAFVAYFNGLKYAPALKYEVIDAKMLGERKAELEILVDTSEVLFKLVKEGGGWKILEDWRKFYSTKVDLLPPIAEFDREDVTATLKYIVLHPATKDSQAYTEVRLDIKNSSGRQIRWQLPIPGTSEGYLTDPSTGRIFYTSHAYGIKAKMSQDFQHIPSKSGSDTLLIGNNVEATLYIHITEMIPENTKELSLFLSGLTFRDNNENWDIVINNAPSHFEVVPNQ